ncbi:sensor histidine kinase [Roseateles depolymerans]|uniref:Histidine kinase/HSP90-like ATPase domain-containing protein n=1 Tax=Roseateles depolymerans TaxID=76731 RepID=A0A0U3MVK6_9BURK|nr:ATP-binding protein [Roseateles depolymerans]ALV07043.1 hypothetical protein RD2015_2578 [Roseateles depolymerans]REG20026.1 histidine kinase/DNA gyrase B/HSP90-like ATPase [Roseateles depolymerans]
MITLPPPAGRRHSVTPVRRSTTCRLPQPSGTRPVSGRGRPASVARALSAAEGRERERIATVLHDEVGALIVRIRLRMSEWRHSQSRLPAPEVDEMCAWIGKLSHTVRTLTTALAPPAWHGGLPGALEAMAQELGLGGDARGPLVRVESGGPDFDLPEPMRSIICRVVRELCLNVLKHAKARRLDITPRLVDGWLCIQVQDDGVGLPDPAHPADPADMQVPASNAPRPHGPATGGLGLAGSRAQLRAIGGSLHLRWEADRGTCATVLVPLPAHLRPSTPSIVELPPRSHP